MITRLIIGLFNDAFRMHLLHSIEWQGDYAWRTGKDVE